MQAITTEHLTATDSPLLKETLSNRSNHKCSAFGPAIAYYSIFSFGPLMLIATVIAGVAFGTEAARGALSGQVRDLLGDTGAQALQALLNGADHQYQGLLATAALFEAGKFLIGYYVGKLALQSTYGAAASLVMLLIWVYYSAQIVLLGDELTHVYARRHGRHTKAAPEPIEQPNAPVEFRQRAKRSAIG